MNTGFVRLAVATVPTVYGIETPKKWTFAKADTRVATVPTVYGIETTTFGVKYTCFDNGVATVPTVYGIETLGHVLAIITTYSESCNSTYRLRY